MNRVNKQRVEADQINWFKQKYPNVPIFAMPKVVFSDSNSTRLEDCIINFLTYNGHHAVRQHTTGTMIDKREVVTDVLGRQRQVGSIQWGASRDELGRADIIAKIMVGFKGRLLPISVEIEVKYGKDYQSDRQKDFQAKLENIGAYYTIVKDFDSFLIWYDAFMKSFD
jgi:hypothetical protein